MAEGSFIIDDYTLLTAIANGNHCQVWEVSEPGRHDHLVMKLLKTESMKDSDNLRALKHEAKVGQSLSHPNLIAIRKLVVTRQHAYLVEDYFRAPNVKAQLQSGAAAVQQRFTLLFEAVCHALGHMHQHGWVHKDIKPDNILMNRAGEVRLIDFSLSARISSGISKLIAGKSKTIQGTRTYIAPETLRRLPPTPQTDVYSLGVTFFEVLTGQPPFTGSSPNELLSKHINARPPKPSDINPNVTPEMDRLVLRMLEKEPARRHADMADLFSQYRSLRPFVKAVVDESKPESSPEDLARLRQQSGETATETSPARRTRSKNDSGAQSGKPAIPPVRGSAPPVRGSAPAKKPPAVKSPSAARPAPSTIPPKTSATPPSPTVPQRPIAATQPAATPPVATNVRPKSGILRSDSQILRSGAGASAPAPSVSASLPFADELPPLTGAPPTRSTAPVAPHDRAPGQNRPAPPRPPAPSPTAPEEELPFMDELPPIL